MSDTSAGAGGGGALTEQGEWLAAQADAAQPPVLGIGPGLAAPAKPRSVSVPDDRPDREHPTDEGQRLEPYDGDTAAERDAAWHTSDRYSEDW